VILYDKEAGIKLYPVRPVYEPLMPLMSCFALVTEQDLGVVSPIRRLTFQPEYDQQVHYPDTRVHVLDVPWRWYCEDCHYASGDTRDIFKTVWQLRRQLTDWRTSPTSFQQDEIYTHAKQHQIMWSWVRGLK
jgi:hypothetical protein